MAEAPLVQKRLFSRRERQLYRTAAEKFNVHAKEGVAFLLAQGLIAEESPGELARVFHTVEVRCRHGNKRTPQPNHAPQLLNAIQKSLPRPNRVSRRPSRACRSGASASTWLSRTCFRSACWSGLWEAWRWQGSGSTKACEPWCSRL